MTVEEIIRLILTGAAGLGLGTMLNSWLTQRWQSRREAAKELANIISELIAIVGSAKDQVAENDLIRARAKRGEITPEAASESLKDGQVNVGVMIMRAHIACQATGVDGRALLIAIDEYRLSAIETMRRQREFLEETRIEVPGETFVMKGQLSRKEQDLVDEAAKFAKAMNRASF